MREGTCDRCGKRAMINFAFEPVEALKNPPKDKPFWQRRPSGDYCAECFELFWLPEAHGAPYPLADASWRHNNNPGFDNVIRALEEDRD